MNSGGDQRRGRTSAVGRAFFVLFWGLLLPVLLYGQNGEPEGTKVDSTQVVPPDSTGSTEGDSTTATASGPQGPAFVRVGAPPGSVTPLLEKPGYRIVDKREAVWDLYFTAYDLLQPELPAYGLSQGSPGLVRGFSLFGEATDAVSTLFNGRPMRDVNRDALDLELYPMEFIERIEVLKGARALLYGSGQSLRTVNFVAPVFDVDGSYTRIWYAQGTNNLTGADLMYARNVGAHTNLSLGFRRLPSDGEFPNQDVSSWDVHGSLRWDPIASLSVSLTEFYTDATRGQNGGLTSTSVRSPAINASVGNTVLDEETLRHDLTLSARWYPLLRTSFQDTSDLSRGDTTTRLDGALYYSYGERDLLSDDTLASLEVVGDVPVQIQRDLLGARLGAILPLTFANLELNGTGELLGSGKFRLEAGGMLELPLGDVATLRGAAKLQKSRGGEYWTLAGDGTIFLGDSLSLFGSLRQSVELSAADGALDYAFPDSVRVFDEYFTSFFAEGGVALRAGGGRVEANAYLRRATPRGGTSLTDGYSVLGADARLFVPYGFMRLDLRLLAMSFPEGDKRFPQFSGSGDLYAQLRLLQGNLDLRGGIKLDYQTSLVGSEYDVVSGRMTYPLDPQRSSFQSYPLMTAYLRARLGSAYLRAEIRNLLGIEYWSIYRYPVWGTALYLGVTWALID